MNGVTFGEKHSYRDFGLTLQTRPEISPPVPKTVYIDIPASDGKLDLTESLTGDVKYNNRIIVCNFNVIGNRDRWADIYSEILAYLHGKQMRIIMDDDPAYYYFGRVSVNQWKSSKLTSTIVIEADVEPYKYDVSYEEWLWDTFDFETGVIREYQNLTVDGTLEVLIPGDGKKLIPTISATAAMTVSCNGTVYALHVGKNKIVNLVLGQEDNVLIFSGNGQVSIDYKGGRL